MSQVFLFPPPLQYILTVLTTVFRSYTPSQAVYRLPHKLMQRHNSHLEYYRPEHSHVHSVRYAGVAVCLVILQGNKM